MERGARTHARLGAFVVPRFDARCLVPGAWRMAGLGVYVLGDRRSVGCGARGGASLMRRDTMQCVRWMPWWDWRRVWRREKVQGWGGDCAATSESWVGVGGSWIGRAVVSRWVPSPAGILFWLGGKRAGRSGVADAVLCLVWTNLGAGRWWKGPGWRASNRRLVDGECYGV